MAIASPFELALWQSISRHLDITESTESTASLLAHHLPLQSLTTRRLEPEHRRVRVVARWTADSENQSAGEIQLPDAAWGRLERWVRQKSALHSATDGTKAKALIELLQMSNADGDWLVAPLVGEHGSRGVLTAWVGGKRRFTAAD